MLHRIVVVAFVCLGLASCSGTPPEAVRTAKRLLSAACADDLARFEAEIDRAKVREGLRRQILQTALTSRIDVEGGPSDRTLDRMISHEGVHQVWVAYALAAGGSAGRRVRQGSVRAQAIVLFVSI